MKDEMKKRISELFEKMDEKILEAKINQAMDMIKNGEHDELVKKLNTMDKAEILEKLKEVESMPPENLDRLQEKVETALSNENVRSLKQNLDEDGRKIIEKIVSTFKRK